MRPLHLYFLGTASWFLAYGIQSVVFAWLVTIVLHETPDKVGIAQMAFLLPSMLFMLVGGSLADHYGGRRIAMIGHCLASSAPLYLILLLEFGSMTYASVLVFAVVMGSAQALVTPSRDGLLALVADGRIQRRVVQTSMIQFGIQVVGFLLASRADDLGASLVLQIQCALLLGGAVVYYALRLPADVPHRTGAMFDQIRDSILEGFSTVRGSSYMSAVVLQNCAMGMFFMGTYIVSIPLTIREVYGGSSAELGWTNAANSIGLVTTIMLLLRFGDVRRPGRALLISQGLGGICLATAGLGLGFATLLTSILVWGFCGGIAMTMSRTIMQELAPPNQRARMMAFYSFSFMGSGPLGALLSGYLSDWLGPANAIIVSACTMVIVIGFVVTFSPLWRLDTSRVNEGA